MEFQFLPDDVEMLQSFVDEATEYLQIIEEEALRLETAADPIQPLATIFRQIHTVKGLSAFFGLSLITDLSHQAEFMLDAMRKGRMKPNQHSVGLLLVAKDMLIDMVKQIGTACNQTAAGEEMNLRLECPAKYEQVIAEMKELTSEKQPEVRQDESAIEITPEEEDELQELIEKAAEGMLEDFLVEADEHGTAITNEFLMVLDITPNDAPTLAEVFRRVHSLKGNIGLLLSVGISSQLRGTLKNLLEAFQDLESLLAKTRDAKIPVSNTVTNLCFAVMDALLKVTTMIRSGNLKPEDDFLIQLMKDVRHSRQAMDNMDESIAVERISIAAGGEVVKAGSIPVQAAAEAPGNAETVRDGEEGKRRLAAEPSFASASNTIRVNGEKLDRLMNVIGELTITKNVFARMARKLMLEHGLPQMAREMKETGQFINRISEELEDAIMSMRMTEVRTVFQKFPRIVRDIALQTGKNISLTMEGEDTELDKNIVEQIGDPLLHLVRNAADHGVETIEQRLAAGKEEIGRIKLRAYNKGKSVIIEVEDDGKGMDPEALRKKAVEKGFISPEEAAALSNEQCFQLIFLPGFSTAQTVSEISGRGVGMDVVRSNITALQGIIRISSEFGRGSRITIQLPLTLMVSKGLLVETAGQALIIPLENVLETMKVQAHSIVKRKGKRMFHHRNEVLGIVSLAELLNMPGQEQDIVPMVLISNGVAKVGLMVDRLLNEQDVLVKSLPDYLSNLPGMGGATILGDGKVALVLNASELVELAQG